MSLLKFGKLSDIISSNMLSSPFSSAEILTLINWLTQCIVRPISEQSLIGSVHFSSFFYLLFLRLNNFNCLIFKFAYFFFSLFKSAFEVLIYLSLQFLLYFLFSEYIFHCFIICLFIAILTLFIWSFPVFVHVFL